MQDATEIVFSEARTVADRSPATRSSVRPNHSVQGCGPESYVESRGGKDDADEVMVGEGVEAEAEAAGHFPKADVDVEIDGKQDEVKQDEVIEYQHPPESEEAQPVRKIITPEMPTQEEVDQHNVDHIPFRSFVQMLP